MDKFKKLSEDFAKQLQEAFAKPEVKELLANIKAAGTNTGTFRVLITNEAVDRAGEMIKADGWDIGPYMKSPVVLWGHDYKQPPIGITTKLVREGTALIAEGIFAPSPFAQEIRQLYDMGIQRAASVGFIPKEMEGNIITKAELLEWSFVAVPCNAEALSMLSIRGLNVGEFAAKGLITKEDATTEEVPVETKPEDEAPVETTEETTTETPTEKGAVEEQITAEDEREKKMEMLQPVYEVLGAFMDVFYSEDTPSADFSKLLAETAGLLASIADGTYAGGSSEEGKSIANSIKQVEKTAIESLVEAIKAGREGNKKAVADVELAKTSAKTLVVALEGLLEKAGAERKATDVEVSKADDTKAAQDFLFLRSVVQNIASVVGEGLSEARKRALEKNYY